LLTLTSPTLANKERKGAREMKSPITGYDAMSRNDMLVHSWRVSQLTRLGISGPLAEIYADGVDWHQIARLVQRGCPPHLALRIVR
jgi:hypothetical protein